MEEVFYTELRGDRVLIFFQPSLVLQDVFDSSEIIYLGESDMEHERKVLNIDYFFTSGMSCD